jgi:alkylhydroperoxidase family enzyme
MPRISYQPLDLAEPRDVVDAVRARRGGTLLNLDRMLLHSPSFAKGWNAFLGEVRTGLTLSPRLRELAMCAVAVLNGAPYEFHHHAPEFLKAGGSAAQVDALGRLDSHAHEVLDSILELFDPVERAVLRLTIAMTRQVQVDDASFQSVREALADERHVVELVGVIATYNMVSRFLVALGIEPE